MNTFTATTEQPILNFLNALNPDISWEKEFAEGKIRVGKHFVGRHYILSPGDRVIHDVNAEIPEPKVNFYYRTIYEDEVLAVIDKPVPLPIHPTGTYFHHTLTRLLQREGKPWHTVHRLDNETSGVFLLSKKAEHTESLRQSLLSGKKTYLVLIYGLTPPRFSVDIPLGKKVGSQVFKRQGHVPDISPTPQVSLGKESHTRFRRIAVRQDREGNPLSLLVATPLTGRTHQIRAHLSESGFPVVGDKIYGKDETYFLRYLEGRLEEVKEELELERQFLHCLSITIVHPFTGKKIRFKAGWPCDLKEYWDNLNKEK